MQISVVGVQAQLTATCGVNRQSEKAVNCVSASAVKQLQVQNYSSNSSSSDSSSGSSGGACTGAVMLAVSD